MSRLVVTPAPMNVETLLRLHMHAHQHNLPLPDHDGIKYGEFHVHHPTFSEGRRRLYHRIYEVSNTWEPKTETQKKIHAKFLENGYQVKSVHHTYDIHGRESHISYHNPDSGEEHVHSVLTG